MQERFSQLHDVLARVRRITAFDKLSSHIHSLSAGDKLVAYALGALVVIFSVLGLYALERSFLVEIPSEGGSLTEGVLGSPRFVNPLLAISDTDRDLVALTFAGLMGRQSDGTLIPVVAESYVVSEDGKNYTFVIREKARFSDGTPITAEDIVFTVKKAQDPGLKSPRLSDWAGITVESIDARTVRFTLPNAYAPFLEDTTLGIIPAHIFRDVTNEEFPFSSYMAEPVGSGAFAVEDIERDKNGVIREYRIKANKYFALGRPHLDRIRFVIFSEADELARAYRTGRIESAYGVPDEHAIRAPYSRIFGVFFNQNRNPLFARIEVREALSKALDRERLATETLSGYATPILGPLPPSRDDVWPTLPQDPLAEARAVLEDGGWTFDDETRTWKDEGTELTVTIRTSNVPELRALAEQVQNDWETLGVPVTLEFYEPGDLAQNVIRPREYEALLFGMVIGRDRDLYAFWHSSERNDPGLNIAMYTNSSVDELLERAREEQDPVEAEADRARVEALIAEEYPAVFTHAPDFLYAVPENLSGITFKEVTSPSDRFQGAYAWYRQTEWVWPIFAEQEL